jgi:hypothetical protein
MAREMSTRPTPLLPLPLPPDRWRSRWLVFPDGRRKPVLHRLAEIDWWEPADDEMIRGDGVTVCGKRGFLHMPGVLSRIGLPRCGACCRLTGVPGGDGAPWNQGRDDR